MLAAGFNPAKLKCQQNLAERNRCEQTLFIHSPILTTEETWSVDQRRHLMRTATKIKHDAIFCDFFDKLAAFTSGK